MGAAGHDGRAVPRALLTAGDAGADVLKAFAFEQLDPAVGVVEERIAAVNHDVARFQVRQERLDELVHRFAGLDHEHDAAGALELADQLRDGVRADDVRALGLVGEEVVHLRRGAVVGHDGEAVVVHVEDQILAHDGQADDCDIACRFHDVESGKPN